MGKIDVKDFLKRFIAPQKGRVLSVEGKTIGSHDGATFLTLGERHGFMVTHKTASDMPYYVIAKDMQKNTVIVSHKKPDGVLCGAVTEMVVKNLNWISETPRVGDTFSVRTRYRQTPEQVTCVSLTKSKAIFHFTNPQSAITPGQSAVFYQGEVCLGGGIICNSSLALSLA